MDDAARDWAERALRAGGRARTGPWQVVKERPWATVLRAGTAERDVYLKANAPGGRHEPALAEALARAWPDRVAAPLASEPRRGWLLSEDHGERMADALAPDEQLARWDVLLPRYAELQLASSREPERWLALGVPDRRLRRLPELAEALIRGRDDLAGDERSEMLGLLPELRRTCAELAVLPGADALEHGDLHAANVLVGPRGDWLFDWADASVSHPFCTLLVTCNMATDDVDSAEGRRVVARLRDAYLEPWAALAPAPELRRRFGAALWVAHLGRALDWEHMLQGSDPALHGDWPSHIAGWLRRWLARRDRVDEGTWP